MLGMILRDFWLKVIWLGKLYMIAFEKPKEIIGIIPLDAATLNS